MATVAAGAGMADGQEPLRETLSDCWSRRIDAEHQLIYRLEGSTLVILACRYHYG